MNIEKNINKKMCLTKADFFVKYLFLLLGILSLFIFFDRLFSLGINPARCTLDHRIYCSTLYGWYLSKSIERSTPFDRCIVLSRCSRLAFGFEILNHLTRPDLMRPTHKVLTVSAAAWYHLVKFRVSILRCQHNEGPRLWCRYPERE